MKSIIMLPMVVLLQSCGLKGLPNAEALNASAFVDPLTVTLINGRDYQFNEGTLKGRGQKYHSDYSYRRAIIIGTGK
tara:strand:+ start:70 stop:300 length:231 start_codon:yes stop_codon:yes gene_type:complete